MERTDELAAISDKMIRFRLKKPFSLLPDALAEPYCSILPERLAKTDAFEQIKEAVGSGPFKFVASERIPGQRATFERNADYVPRAGGKPSFSAGPKVAHIERVVWNYMEDPATAAAALAQGEVDWWENPGIDLVPYLQRNDRLVVTVKDRTGRVGCLRFNQLFPPFDNKAVRRVVLDAVDQEDGNGRRSRGRAEPRQNRCRPVCAGNADVERCRHRDHATARRLRKSKAATACRGIPRREGGRPGVPRPFQASMPCRRSQPMSCGSSA